MARINQQLLQRLQQKTNSKKAWIYKLIDRKVNQTHLPRHLAAIALASELGINISKFASEQDLADIRQARFSTAQQAQSTLTQYRSSQGNSSSNRKKPKFTKKRGETVFVVHGRNQSLAQSFFSFLRSIGLRPIEWTQAIKKTKQGSPYVGTILEKAFQDAVSIIVLFTPDDEARLRKQFWKPNEPSTEKTLNPQPRPNVLFEAGMAYGKNPVSTVLVQVGSVKEFSDIAGRHLVHLNNTPVSRKELVVKLENAGCKVDTSGTDWYSIGDFEDL